MVEMEVFDNLILILQPAAKMDSAHPLILVQVSNGLRDASCISRLDCRPAMCVSFDSIHRS